MMKTMGRGLKLMTSLLRRATAWFRVPLVIFLREKGWIRPIESLVFHLRKSASKAKGTSNLALEDAKLLIICANYNHANWLSGCIDSIRNQDFLNWNLVVVDDVSTDRSVEVLAEALALDQRIHGIELNENSGAYLARNTGLKFAEGWDWTHVCFIDPDDLAAPHWLSHLLELFDSKTQFVRPWLQRMDADLKQVLRNYHGHCQTMYTRDIWNALGGFMDVRVAGDTEFLFRALRYVDLLQLEYRFAFDVCQMCREHGGNASKQQLQPRKRWLEGRHQEISNIQGVEGLHEPAQWTPFQVLEAGKNEH
ncbi:MAG: glycosyltransferase family 2 protein [Flavobacteriales bacterium]